MINPLISILEQAISRYLALDPEILMRLAPLSGCVLSVRLTEIPVTFYVFPNARGIQIKDHYERQVDAHIQGSAFTFLKMQTGHRDQSSQLRTKLEISGDIELALQFSQILGQVQIDWEGLVAEYAGDTLAYYVGKAAKSLKLWSQTTRTNLKLNIAEYLQEESKQLPTREEVEDFFGDIAELQNDVARLEAKIKQLHVGH